MFLNQHRIFFQSLLYLLFISGISLAFRIIESTTEFYSMIQSLVSCESGVSVQDSGHIFCVFTPVCYSAFVNTELHFFLVQFAQITWDFLQCFSWPSCFTTWEKRMGINSKMYHPSYLCLWWTAHDSWDSLWEESPRKPIHEGLDELCCRHWVFCLCLTEKHNDCYADIPKASQKALWTQELRKSLSITELAADTMLFNL